MKIYKQVAHARIFEWPQTHHTGVMIECTTSMYLFVYARKVILQKILPFGNHIGNISNKFSCKKTYFKKKLITPSRPGQGSNTEI